MIGCLYSTGAQSSNELQKIDNMTGDQDSSPSNGCQATFEKQASRDLWKNMLINNDFETWLLIGWHCLTESHQPIRSHIRKCICLIAYWGRVMHICISKLNIINVNWTLKNQLQWNFNSYICIQENTFENVVCNMAAILPQPQCVNDPGVWFNIEMLSYKFRNSHYKDKTVSFYNGNPYTGRCHLYIESIHRILLVGLSCYVLAWSIKYGHGRSRLCCSQAGPRLFIGWP